MQVGFGVGIASAWGDGRRVKLQQEVEVILSSAAHGRIFKVKESQGIDFKEEAGRRNGPNIEPGKPQNPEAATKLADEVACMANSPAGGGLIVGVEDATGKIIGTELDEDWLRQRIYEGVDVAPDIVAKRVEGQRILVIYVAPAPEPVEDTSGKLRWRVGDSCRPVDRSEWWERRRAQQAFDEMAQQTDKTVLDVRSGAMEIVSRTLPAAVNQTDEETLRSLGALGAEGNLTVAGELLFTSHSVSVIELSVFDVFGGKITNRIHGEPGKSVLEQLDAFEQALRVVNKNNTVVEGFVHTPIPEIPYSAVREALLNAMIHRDWNRSEPIDVRWVELDSTLIVRSPGGFPPAITSANVLSNRAARYPALADLYRAIGLVDKQGVGVDRMYQSMIALGHRPPTIEEIAGPFVETTLVGGEPVLPVLELMSRIVPEPRQRDYRIAIILYLLFARAFVTENSVAGGLQSGLESALNALESAQQTTVDGEPLVEEYGEVWKLGTSARKILAQGGRLPYLSTNVSDMEKVAVSWLREVGDLTTSTLVDLCSVSRGTANKCIEKLIADGVVERIGGGRSTRYRLL
ncbi:transcriptional regulator [Corynebacterium sp. HMSC073H12]|uniref:DUF5635 domain-containing protein n=1 Tax=Corynebacterium sp. HMSC073H12 TaxID=1715187 RepID=UPI0008AA5599|nr:DUF5635 domain-containing protein [Corynebacterium sp. HMSC073H12]OHQ78212.1 transcriptional regulator [Corynebacterium sp. HMSC073H12]